MAAPLSLAGQEDWDGYSGVSDYQGSNGNTWQVMSEAHKIRDQAYGATPKATDTCEVYDCVVVGGGISDWPDYTPGLGDVISRMVKILELTEIPGDGTTRSQRPLEDVTRQFWTL